MYVDINIKKIELKELNWIKATTVPKGSKSIR